VVKEEAGRAGLNAHAERVERLAAQGWYVRPRKHGKWRARRIVGLEWVA
jgi:hypothetical protein